MKQLGARRVCRFTVPILVEALRAAEVNAVPMAWDEPAVDWSMFDLVVIRSPWDYSWRAEEFLRWVDETSRVTRFANPRDIVRWNSDKRYLLELASRGVPTVPTQFLSPGDPVELGGTAGDFVVKPAVGAGARYAARYREHETANAYEHVRQLHHEGVTAMVQPYLSVIDTVGERALVFIGNQFIHAIRKNAVLSVGLRYDEKRDAHPSTEPWEPTPGALALAEKVLSTIPQRQELLYARVDMVVDPSDNAVLTELELIEPQLYLRFHRQSLPAVVAAFDAAGQAALQARQPCSATGPS